MNILKIKNIISLVISLAIIDFKEQFKGSYLGIVWAIIRPLIFISAVWFIFSIGIKHKPIENNTPFILYLLTGYSAWIFFSTSLTAVMNAFSGNITLVKRPSFPVIILPIVKIVSSFFLHLVFLSIVVVVLIYFGNFPNIYWLQLPYYIIILCLLVFGLGLSVASLNLFTKDIPQFIAAILQIGFWVTPIFWSYSRVPKEYLWILKFNPMVYIVNGYRNTFLNKVWFWEDNYFLFSFIIYILFFLVSGILVYKKLRPHFGDVV